MSEPQGELVDVVAINLRQKIAVSSTDQVGKITNLFANDGEETEDPEEAITGVVEWPDGTWSSVDLRHFEFGKIN